MFFQKGLGFFSDIKIRLFGVYYGTKTAIKKSDQIARFMISHSSVILPLLLPFQDLAIHH